MLRDTRKDAEYFERYLLENEGDITHRKRSGDALPVENVRGKKINRCVLAGLYRDRMWAMYSSGYSLDEIEPFFIPYIDCSVVSADMGIEGYNIVNIFSLAVLFDMRKSVDSLKEILEKTEWQDLLTDILLHSLDDSWPVTSEKTMFKWFPDFLKLPEEERSGYLQNFLQKHWYQQHRDAGWYNNHNSKYDTYAGYWAFDVAAVAKVFHVPDSPKWKYYPYDLAHYKWDV